MNLSRGKAAYSNLNLLIVLIPTFFLFYRPLIFSTLVIFCLYLIPSKQIINYGKILVIILAFIFSLSILSKTPYSDLAVYIDHYQLYGQLDFQDFLSQIRTDFVFHYVNFFLHGVTNGSNKIFTLFWPFFSYSLIGLSLLRFYKNGIINKFSFILSLSILFFSTTFLSLVSHLIRQIFASSVFLYYLSFLCFGKRNKLLLLLMIGVHFSSIVLLLYPIIKNKFILIALFTLTAIVMLFDFNIFTLIPSFVYDSNIPYIEFILGHIEGAVLNNQDNGSVPYVVYLVSFTILFILYYMNKIQRLDERVMEIVLAFLFVFILFNLFEPIKLLWLRFSFYQYIFYIALIPITLSSFIKINQFTKLIYWQLSLLLSIKYMFFFEKDTLMNYNFNPVTASLFEILDFV